MTAPAEDQPGSQPEFDDLPDWLRPLAEAAVHVRPEQLSRFLPPEEGGRESAVLMLFGEDADRGAGWDAADVLLIERAHDMRSHAGQVAFPGGAVDAGGRRRGGRRAARGDRGDRSGLRRGAGARDAAGAVPAAERLRRDTGARLVARAVAGLGRGHRARSRRCTGCRSPSCSTRPTGSRCSHPSGYVGAAFDAAGLLVWGFTAGLLDRMLRLAGWEQPWDRSEVRPLPPEALPRDAGRG